jgi:hypothetical protein
MGGVCGNASTKRKTVTESQRPNIPVHSPTPQRSTKI